MNSNQNNSSIINYKEVEFYPPLIQDYLNGTLKTKNIVDWEYSSDEIINKIPLKKFSHRNVLSEIISEQYQGIALTDSTKKNIVSLQKNTTFTITTGHQLCIYGGPAYFFSKIIDTIKLCDSLNKKNNQNHFIPLFWLASEDHDFEEISSISWFNQHLKWDKNSKGAVGELTLESLQSTTDSMLLNFGPDLKSDKLKQIILKSFNQSNSLSTAIRILVNELLGEFGVLILDGNHPKLKALFAPYAIQEIQESFCVNSVNKKITQLSGYKIQAKPRNCNLFYLDKNYRERLEIIDDSIVTSDGLHQWKTIDFIEKIKRNPEIISPNVLLRPLYQEIVLPNLAYIGGAGEIAYWLELPEMFAQVNIQFPVPIVRNSYLYLKPKQIQQIQNLNLNINDFFLREDLLLKSFIEKNSEVEFSLSNEKQALDKLFEALEKRAIAIDPNLSKVVKGEHTKNANSLEHLEKRFRNAEKSKYDAQIKIVQQLKEKIFPNGIFQERKVSLIELMLKSDVSIFENLITASSPLDNSIKIIQY